MFLVLEKNTKITTQNTSNSKKIRVEESIQSTSEARPQNVGWYGWVSSWFSGGENLGIYI